MQTTSYLLMVRPVNFSFNAETAVNNAFQIPAERDPLQQTGDKTQQTNNETQQKALGEFNKFVAVLRANGVDVTVVDDTPEPYTPDSIFPNNWVSFHEDGTLCLYPMYAHNRRLERKEHVLEAVSRRFKIARTLDFSHYEEQGFFLEGTGSMVLDRENKIAYACLSPRTDEKVLADFCGQMGYRPVVFRSTDAKRRDIYHTNVMMCVADNYVIVCLDSLPDPREKELLVDTIKGSDKEVVTISLEQMNHFAGNMLQVNNARGEKLLVLSSQAYAALEPGQQDQLQAFNRILHSPLDTIEMNGGGSARCMMAEIHLPVIFSIP